MSENTNWHVEKHRAEHECDEHWELRKNFLEAHKEKFPEDELVCLAQVFTNVELLGCRYPKETMDLIAELSEDVAKDYRARQKTKLQRTFVKASDAASSKIKSTSRNYHCPACSHLIMAEFSTEICDEIRDCSFKKKLSTENLSQSPDVLREKLKSDRCDTYPHEHVLTPANTNKT